MSWICFCRLNIYIIAMTSRKDIRGLPIETPDASLAIREAQEMVAAYDEAVLVLIDEDESPQTPIKDARIEKFLTEITERALTNSKDIYRIYKQCNLPLSGDEVQSRNLMKSILSKKRVKMRWKYMQSAEWDIRKPTRLSLQQQYESLLDDEETRPADKIRALNGLEKLMTMSDEESEGISATVVFNAMDRPKGPVIDVETDK
mgnify:CR=1 FL=1